MTSADVADVCIAHYPALVRLAALLLRQPAAAEDVVQDAYIRVSAAHQRIKDADATLAYLRQAVVNQARSNLRRAAVGAARLRSMPMSDEATDDSSYQVLQRHAIVTALARLPRRQREVIVLRYYADLTERQTADALGIGIGSVKAYAWRGLEALGTLLEEKAR